MVRMPDPTVPQCDCGVLEDAANDPSMPITFNAQLNEYYIERKGELGGELLIYHCPFCGGSAPKSKRGSLFFTVTAEEMHRLRDIAVDVKTVSDALLKFGEPDQDIPSGYGETSPKQNGGPTRTQFFRVLRYQNLSETAVVDFVVQGEEVVSFTYSPKGKHDG